MAHIKEETPRPRTCAKSLLKKPQVKPKIKVQPRSTSQRTAGTLERTTTVRVKAAKRELNTGGSAPRSRTDRSQCQPASKPIRITTVNTKSASVATSNACSTSHVGSARSTTISRRCKTATVVNHVEKSTKKKSSQASSCCATRRTNSGVNKGGVIDGRLTSKSAAVVVDKPRFAPVLVNAKRAMGVKKKKKRKKRKLKLRKKLVASKSNSKNDAISLRHQLTECFAKAVGVDEASRPEAVKYLWDYIKKKGLQDNKDGRIVKLDNTLKAIFGSEYDYDYVHLLNLPSLISKCFVQNDDDDGLRIPSTLLDGFLDDSEQAMVKRDPYIHSTP